MARYSRSAPWWWQSGVAFLSVLRPRLHDLAVEAHVLQPRLAVLLGGVLDAVVEEVLGFRQVLAVASPVNFLAEESPSKQNWATISDRGDATRLAGGVV